MLPLCCGSLSLLTPPANWQQRENAEANTSSSTFSSPLADGSGANTLISSSPSLARAAFS
eukprot:m.740559 g.740559  ORF g.740559 m.740559 type:complete len:60 (-) comp58928_c0_seq9:172-351(-)